MKRPHVGVLTPNLTVRLVRVVSIRVLIVPSSTCTAVGRLSFYSARLMMGKPEKRVANTNTRQTEQDQGVSYVLLYSSTGEDQK